jgi:hypothetical protein
MALFRIGKNGNQKVERVNRSPSLLCQKGGFMEITSISRKISGYAYDNISVTATIQEGDDPIEVAKALDIELQKMLNAIREQENETMIKRKEQQETVSLLKRALDFAEKEDIPF